MDILTHAMTGLVLASPLWPDAPLTAAGFVFGSVLPDLDALARLFGKRAFLRWHQTYTHSVPVILAALAGGWLLAPEWAKAEPWALPAVAAGKLLHVAMDVSNTYGTAVLAPLYTRRVYTEWVFFIDAPVIAAVVVALAWVGWRIGEVGRAGPGPAAAYAAFLAGYWALKIALHRAAFLAGPAGTLSLIPSALVPWRFLGYRREGDEVVVFSLNLRTRKVSGERRVAVLDGRFAATLSTLPEFRVMRQLSPGYHVTEAEQQREGTRVVCRDLRTRNFDTRFGRLEAVIAPDGAARKAAFHV